MAALHRDVNDNYSTRNVYRTERYVQRCDKLHVRFTIHSNPRLPVCIIDQDKNT